jgi:hypothetical protein
LLISKHQHISGSAAIEWRGCGTELALITKIMLAEKGLPGCNLLSILAFVAARPEG